MAFFSIVIPAYNRAESLSRTIESVISQTFRDFELLVMDDGSIDHTAEVVKAFCDPRISYSWAPNSGGPATPRNRGLDVATAPWISFLDADDIWLPNRLAVVSQAINNSSHVDVFCHDEFMKISGSAQQTRLRHGPCEEDFYRILLLQGNRLSTSAVTIRTDFLRRNQLRFNPSPDYTIIEDYDLWLHLANKKARFEFISEPLGIYMIENDNISSDLEKLLRNQKTMLAHHVHQLQGFEQQKNLLWRTIECRLDIEYSKELLRRGKISRGLYAGLKRSLKNPLLTLRHLFPYLRRSNAKILSPLAKLRP